MSTAAVHSYPDLESAQTAIHAINKALNTIQEMKVQAQYTNDEILAIAQKVYNSNEKLFLVVKLALGL